MEEKKKETKKYDILKKTLQVLLFIGLGVFFVWISVRGLSEENWVNIKESIAGVNTAWGWSFLGLSFITCIIAHYLRAIRSILLMESMNYCVRKSMSFYAVMVCYLANIVFPRLGEVLRCTFLQRYEKVPFQKALGTIVSERALDMIIWLVLLVVAILLNTSVLMELTLTDDGTTLKQFLDAKTTGLLTNYWFYLALGLVIVAVIVIYVTRNKWNKIAFFNKLKKFFLGIWQGLISIKDLKKPALFWVYTLLIWVFYFLGTYTVFIAFGYHLTLPYHAILPAFSVLVFATIGFMIAPEGIGAYPLIVAGTLVLYKEEYSAGFAAGWVGWSVQTLMVVVFGFASLILASFSKRKNSEN